MIDSSLMRIGFGLRFLRLDLHMHLHVLQRCVFFLRLRGDLIGATGGVGTTGPTSMIDDSSEGLVSEISYIYCKRT